MMTNFKINGVPIKRPYPFDVTLYKITDSTRLANGDMAMEFVAKKRKFNFNYAVLTSSDKKVLLDQIWEPNSCFFTLEYVEDNVTKTATVYASEIPFKLSRSGTFIRGEWVWKDVSFSLIER